MLSPRLVRSLVIVAFGMFVPGCSGCSLFQSFQGRDSGASLFDVGPIDCDPTMPGCRPLGQGVGERCGSTLVCRSGLSCGEAGLCVGAGTSSAGTRCSLTAECASGLYCGPGRLCTTGGSLTEGASCRTTAECVAGLVCSIEGLGAVCRTPNPGRIAGDGGVSTSGDFGSTCTLDIDCLAGLSCLADPTAPASGAFCSSAPAISFFDGSTGIVPPNLPYWPGQQCTDDSAASPVAYFRIPRASVPATDFYRLPFPNDIRRTATGLDLSGHPTPATALPGNLIDAYLRASEQDLRGFSTNPQIYFRFSRPYNWDSVSGDSVRLYDVTVGQPEFGQELGRAWTVTFGPTSKYLCPDWLGVRVGHGSPLRPGHTYAAILTLGINDSASRTPFARDPDFEAMLSATAPLDADLMRAWTAYAPLRQLASTSGAPSMLTAAVFTTQDPLGVMRRAAAVIAQGAAPTVTDLVSGDSGQPSPCDDGTPETQFGGRDDRYIEVHGRIALPIFQAGTAPYERPEDGGAFALDATGTPVIQRTENVCFAMTIPRGGTMPPTGFPVVIHGHGTGGSFRSAIANGIAGDLASGEGGSTRAVLIGFDLPSHGTRRNGSTRDPDQLFFNFVNPRAARDNVLQGAVDLLSVLRFARSYSADAATSPIGAALDFDEQAVGFFTHSQGSTHLGLALPFVEQIAAVVMSGQGGDLNQSLLTKSEPVDIARVLPFALLDANADGSLAGGDWHPMLGIFQMYFDASDPVNYARTLHAAPEVPDRIPNVFLTYGRGDSYATEATQRAYLNAAELPLVLPAIENFGRPEVAAPLMGNFPLSTGSLRTQGFRQYMPADGDDGHFVAFDVPTARADVLRFLRVGLAGATPPIGP